MKAAEETSKPCLNCGDATPGNFCPVCGQRRTDVRVSLRRLLADVLEDQLSISSALPRTLIAILFRPGYATNEYLAGRIASYIAPFRLYLVTSLIFFLLLSFQTRMNDMRVPAVPVSVPADTAQIGTAEQAATEGDSVSRSNVELGRGFTFTLDGDFEGRITGIERIDRVLASRLEQLGEMEANEAAAVIIPGVLERMPVAMFLLVPLFAFLLKLLYLRTGRFYVEHFIFALHAHSFAFILFCLTMPVPDAISRFMTFVLLLYLVIAMKRVYRQGWFRTIFKWIVLAGAYSIALGTAMVVAVLVAIIAS